MPDLTVRGIRLHWEEHSPSEASGRPLVLLHGLGSSGADWPLQIPTLGVNRRLLMPDLPGHGQSQGYRHWPRVSDFAAAVAEMMVAACAAPVHVLGLSLGGAVALQLALDLPEQVRSLVIVNSLARFRPSLDVLAFGAVWLGYVSAGRMEDVAAWVAQDLFPEPEQGELRQEAALRLARSRRGDYLRAMVSAVRFNVWSRLSSIACPALVVTGQRDRLFPIDRQREIAGRIPRARWVVIPGSRHATPIDAPEEFNRIVLDFIEGVERR